MAAVDDFWSARITRPDFGCTYRDFKESLDVGDRCSLHVDNLLQ